MLDAFYQRLGGFSQLDASVFLRYNGHFKIAALSALFCWEACFVLYLINKPRGYKYRLYHLECVEFGIPIFDGKNPCLVCVRIYLAHAVFKNNVFVYLGWSPHHSRWTLLSTTLPQAFTLPFSPEHHTNPPLSSLPPYFFLHPLAYSAVNTEQSGRPGLYIAMSRCSALERNIPPPLTSVCAPLCVFVCDFSFIPVFPSCTADSDSAAKHRRTGPHAPSH